MDQLDVKMDSVFQDIQFERIGQITARQPLGLSSTRLRIDSLCGGLRGAGQTQRLPRRDLSNSLEMEVLEHRIHFDVKLVHFDVKMDWAEIQKPNPI